MKQFKCDVTKPDKRVYGCWRTMLYRYHGTTNRVICNSWYTYSNFERDIKTLPGYDDWVNKKGYWLTVLPDNNVYSRDTCHFIHNANVQRNVETILTPEEVEEAYKMWCDGYTQQEIADQFFVSDRTIRRAFNGRKKVKIAKEGNI